MTSTDTKQRRRRPTLRPVNINLTAVLVVARGLPSVLRVSLPSYSSYSRGTVTTPLENDSQRQLTLSVNNKNTSSDVMPHC